MDQAGLRIVPRKDRVDVRRPLERRALASEQRDRPPLAAAVHLRGRRDGAREVGVGDAREVDAAGGREPVPLPEARVDRHQLEAAVADIALELDLRQAEVSELPQQREGGVDGLLHPDRLADTACADTARRLAKLASREDSQEPVVPRQVAPDGEQRAVATRNELLQHWAELLGSGVCSFDFGKRLAPEGLAAEALLEADRPLRLDQNRDAELLCGGSG